MAPITNQVSLKATAPRRSGRVTKPSEKKKALDAMKNKVEAPAVKKAEKPKAVKAAVTKPAERE
jgi:hypothetical protein